MRYPWAAWARPPASRQWPDNLDFARRQWWGAPHVAAVAPVATERDEVALLQRPRALGAQNRREVRQRSASQSYPQRIRCSFASSGAVPFRRKQQRRTQLVEAAPAAASALAAGDGEHNMRLLRGGRRLRAGGAARGVLPVQTAPRMGRGRGRGRVKRAAVVQRGKRQCAEPCGISYHVVK